jgi:uncharacterized protein (DUF433 family)
MERETGIEPATNSCSDPEGAASLKRYNLVVTLKAPFDRITIEPGKMGGKPCVRGLRISVENVLEIIASYPDRKVLFENYPDLEEEDLRQALAFAAANLDDRVDIVDLLPDTPNVSAAS